MPAQEVVIFRFAQQTRNETGLEVTKIRLSAITLQMKKFDSSTGVIPNRKRIQMLLYVRTYI